MIALNTVYVEHGLGTAMEKQLPLILAVEGLAYSGGEMAELLRLILDERFEADFQLVPPLEILETAKRQKPDLIIIGYLPLPDLGEHLRFAPTGSDVVRDLKSDRDTRDIPVLMLSGFDLTPKMLELVDPELEGRNSEALSFGVDAYLSTPFDPTDFVGTVKRLIGKQPPIMEEK